MLSSIHIQNMGNERMFNNILKNFLVLNPFLLDPDHFCQDPDPDQYQSSPWIWNKFFHILDPDPYQDDTDPNMSKSCNFAQIQVSNAAFSIKKHLRYSACLSLFYLQLPAPGPSVFVTLLVQYERCHLPTLGARLAKDGRSRSLGL